MSERKGKIKVHTEQEILEGAGFNFTDGTWTGSCGTKGANNGTKGSNKVSITQRAFRT